MLYIQNKQYFILHNKYKIIKIYIREKNYSIILSLILRKYDIFNNYNKLHENIVLLTRENKLCAIAYINIITCNLT